MHNESEHHQFTKESQKLADPDGTTTPSRLASLLASDVAELGSVLDTVQGTRALLKCKV